MSLQFSQEAAKIYIEHIRALHDDEKYLSDNLQKASVWIVSLATASVGLLLTQGDNLTSIPNAFISISVVTLTLCIICSFTSRIINIHLIRQTFHALRLLEIVLKFEKADIDTIEYDVTGKEASERAEIMKAYDYVLSDGLGYTPDEWATRLNKAKLPSGPKRERLFKGANILYWVSIGLFLLSIVVLTLGYLAH